MFESYSDGGIKETSEVDGGRNREMSGVGESGVGTVCERK